MLSHCPSADALLHHPKVKTSRKKDSPVQSFIQGLIVGWRHSNGSFAVEGSLQSLLLERTYDFGLNGERGKQMAPL